MKRSSYKSISEYFLFPAKTEKNLSRFLKRGMTLIEIMIVVGILALFMGYLGAKVKERSDKAKISQAKIIISLVEDAITEFNLDCGFYPETLDDLVSAPRDCEEWGPKPYFKNGKIPKDPWKNDLVYEMDDSGNYTIISFGQDRRPGGTGFKKDLSSAD